MGVELSLPALCALALLLGSRPAAGLGGPSHLGLSSSSLPAWVTSWSQSTGAGGVAWPTLCLLLPSGDVSGEGWPGCALSGEAEGGAPAGWPGCRGILGQSWRARPSDDG